MKFPLEDVEVPFLKEHELKKNIVINPEQIANNLTVEQQEERIKKLTEIGASPQQARELLIQTAWNPNQAVALFLEMSNLD